jgi:hypothetical protein
MTAEAKRVHLAVELSDEETRARAKAQTDADAYAMQYGAERLRKPCALPDMRRDKGQQP